MSPLLGFMYFNHPEQRNWALTEWGYKLLADRERLLLRGGGRRLMRLDRDEAAAVGRPSVHMPAVLTP